VLGEAAWRRMRFVPTSLRRVLAGGIGAVSYSTARRVLAPASRWIRNPADKVERLARILPAADPEDLARRLLSTWWVPPLAEHFDDLKIPRLPRRGTVAEQIAYADTLTTLPDEMLVKVDRASMRVALEVRVPLLDHRVVEWVWQQPFDLRLRRGTGKWVLREVLARYVPRRLTDRPKMGFDPPIGEWLRGPLRSWASELLLPSELLASELDAVAIEGAWRSHQSGRRDRTYELWAVVMYQAWRHRSRG